MKSSFPVFFTSRKKYLLLVSLLSLLFLNCKKKDIIKDTAYPVAKTDSVAYQEDSEVDNSSEDEIKERETYLSFLADFLSKKPNQQSIDILNVKVEAAMPIYANRNAFKDEKFLSINDDLVRFIEGQNDLKIPESFYTAGLMESYGYFSDVDGHAINHFKKGAKLGSANCVKYLTIIYFERILYKHKVTDYCDPVCMFHRGRNYIEETSLANITKNEILAFTSKSSNFLLKIIEDHLKFKMSDDQISAYVFYLRTHSNPLYKLNSTDFPGVTSEGVSNLEDFLNVLENTHNIQIKDIAELFTFNYPAYENDDKFLHFAKLDLEKKGIEIFDECQDKYNLDQLYGLTDFGSSKIYTGFLKYFSEKGDQKSQKLLMEYNNR